MKDRAEIVIDKTGHIVECNSAWDRMMRARRLRHLTGSQIAGQEFRSLIPTSTRRQITDGIVESVRTQKQSIELGCQSARSGEQFQLKVRPLAMDDGSNSIRIEIEQLDGIGICDDIPEIRIIYMCSHCRRIRVSERWVDTAEAAQALHLLCLDPPPPISHGLCPDCFSLPEGDHD